MQRLHGRQADDTHDRQVKRDIGQRQQHQHPHQRQIAAVARPQQHRQQNARHHRQQDHVQRCIDRIGGHHGSHPGGKPEQCQRPQQRTARRGQPCPRLHGREQEPDDDGGGKPEQHFVGVPQQGSDRKIERKPPEHGSYPQRHGQARHKGRAQIKRAKTQTQEWQALQSRGRSHACGGDDGC